jgi:hypothetical protein
MIHLAGLLIFFYGSVKKGRIFASWTRFLREGVAVREKELK